MNGKPHYKTFKTGTCSALRLFLFPDAVCKTQWQCAVWSGWCTKVKIGLLPLHLKSWPLQHTAGLSPAYSVQNAVGSMQSEECGPLNLKSDCSRRWMMKSKSSQLCRRSTQWTVNHTTRHLTLAPAMHCACLGFRVQCAVGSKQYEVSGPLKLKTDYYPYT